MVAGENFGEFGESGAIRQSFTQPNLYHKTAGRLKISQQQMNTKQIAEISLGTCMAKGQPWLANHLDSV